MFENSQKLFAQSQKFIPGGVNSPVRAFRAVGGTPIFFREARGAYMWDVDGNRFIDYVGSWGPAVLGHSHPEVVRAVQERTAMGLSFGAPTELELQMAETLCSLLPSIEQVRLVSSGTEATMSAIRLARGFTGRSKIVKFEGCYHGHGDALLVKAGSGALTFGNPSSAGVPPEVDAACGFLGLDPLHVANEGTLVAIVPPDAADAVLAAMHQVDTGVGATVIGTVTEEHPGVVVARTGLGARRIVDVPLGEQLPRIC